MKRKSKAHIATITCAGLRRGEDIAKEIQKGYLPGGYRIRMTEPNGVCVFMNNPSPERLGEDHYAVNLGGRIKRNGMSQAYDETRVFYVCLGRDGNEQKLREAISGLEIEGSISLR